MSPSVQDLPELEVRVRGQHVSNPALATIRFWNAGTEPVRGEDARSPRIVVEGGEIAAAWISAITTPENFTRLDGHRISFDYLNRGDGAEIILL